MNNEDKKLQDEQLQQETVEAAETVSAEEEFVEITAEEMQIARIAELEAALLSSDAKVKEAQDNVLRARAEGENVRRRSEVEIDKARKFALNKFTEELLPVIDNLERAIEMADKNDEALKSMIEGVELCG